MKGFRISDVKRSIQRPAIRMRGVRRAEIGR